jgi:integrase
VGKLTAENVRNLTPKRTRYELADGEGLSIVVLPSGKMAWRYRYEKDGILQKVELGQYPTMSLTTARRRRREFETSLNEINIPVTEAITPVAALQSTVKDFAERYLSQMAKKKKPPVKGIRQLFDRDILPVLGSKPIWQVTAADIQSILIGKPEAINNPFIGQITKIFRKMFDEALVQTVSTVNPNLTLPVKMLRQVTARDSSSKKEIFSRFLKGIYNASIPRQLKLAMHLVLITLVKKSDLVRARWEDIDLDQMIWRIPSSDNKTEDPYVVQLSKQGVELLRELQSLATGSEWVLPGRGGKPLAQSTLAKVISVVPLPKGITASLRELQTVALEVLANSGFAGNVAARALSNTSSLYPRVSSLSDAADQTKAMLQFWADYVDELLAESRGTHR